MNSLNQQNSSNYLMPLAWCVLAAALLSGCSGASDAPYVVPVSGRVTMQGQPLADVGVTFFPTRGPIATGNTNHDGQFTLMTVEPGDGASLGTHRVVLGSAVEGRGPSRAIPDRYGKPDTSGLTAEVKEDGPNVFTFEVQAE